MALSAPFCPLVFSLSSNQSGRWLVGAVGIEFWSIIPKSLYFQYFTDTHRKVNRGQIEAKVSFGGTARPCYLSYSFNLGVEFRRSSALWRKPLFIVVPRGEFDRTLFHLFCKSRSYEFRQRRNTEAEMDPPCADVFKMEIGVAGMEYGVASGVNTSPIQTEPIRSNGDVRASLV